jgi:hypothetical protein
LKLGKLCMLFLNGKITFYEEASKSCKKENDSKFRQPHNLLGERLGNKDITQKIPRDNIIFFFLGKRQISNHIDRIVFFNKEGVLQKVIY